MIGGSLHGVPNGRDLGTISFLVNNEGYKIKEGMLIRGGEVDGTENKNLTVEQMELGVKVLQSYGIKYDLDLRNPFYANKSALGDDVGHECYDMVMYKDAFTDYGKAKVKEIFEDLANSENYPMYLHCSYGADRVGTIVYILEAVLGISHDNALREYLLSVGSYGNRILEVRDGINAYEGETFQKRAEAYLIDCGVTMEQIESIREILLDD